MTDRMQARVERLKDAHAKMVARVQADPTNPKVEAWKARALEYEASLASLRDHGHERPAGAVGVKIDVPVSNFKLKAG